MSKSTNEVTYHYEVAGHDVAVTRTHIGTAYARNGNASNPTEYFAWAATVDGKTVTTGAYSRSSAYEHARASILGIRYYDHPNYPGRALNVRNFRLVADEMRSNYRRMARA